VSGSIGSRSFGGGSFGGRSFGDGSPYDSSGSVGGSGCRAAGGLRSGAFHGSAADIWVGNHVRAYDFSSHDRNLDHRGDELHDAAGHHDHDAADDDESS